MSDETAISFGEFQIDSVRGEILNAGQPVSVEPQVFDLIAYLARNAGRIVSRDDLIEHVWGGRIVSDSAIASRINAARTTLGDDGQAQKLIKTVPRRGFRFEGDTTSGSVSPDIPQSDNPSIAVLPFRNLSGDPDQAYFSDGITDDIIIELARCRELFVIARQSSFAYRDAATPVSQIARELGVQYVLEGGVRRAGDRIRVTAHLVDPATGSHLWVEKYDRQIEDIFEVQDDITATIVNTLTGEIERESHRRAQSKSADKVNAYDLYLQASELNYKGGRQDVVQSREAAQKAIEIDPDLARAYAVIAWTHIADYLNAWGESPEQSLEAARTSATAAIDADAREPLGYCVMGWVHMCNKDFDRALPIQRRAIALNPGSERYRSLYAFTLPYAGKSEEAIEELEKTMLLNPRHPDLYNAHYGRALFNLRQYEKAIVPLEKLRTSQPGNGNALAVAAACYAALDRPIEAAATVQEVLKASPNYSLDFARTYLPFGRDEDLMHFITHLERAGM